MGTTPASLHLSQPSLGPTRSVGAKVFRRTAAGLLVPTSCRVVRLSGPEHKQTLPAMQIKTAAPVMPSLTRQLPYRRLRFQYWKIGSPVHDPVRGSLALHWMATRRVLVKCIRSLDADCDRMPVIRDTDGLLR